MQITKKIIEKINGQEILLLKFTNDNNYSLSFFNFGGYIDSICIPFYEDPSQSEDVILGYRDFQGYVKDQSYFNCIIGRVCGRISNATFDLNGKKYLLFSNNGPHHLHGGEEGFNKKVWKIVKLEETTDCLKCVLQYISPHLEEGYPGKLECKVTYSLTNNNEFIIDFNAESDEDTIVNLTNHNYWNFHGHHSNYHNITNHTVKINAQFYCESDKDLIPTGKLLRVEKNNLNFLEFKKLNKNILQDNGIDTCYCVSDNVFLDLIELNESNLKEVATAYSGITKMGCIMYANKPGLQFYTGNMMNKHYDGKYNKTYGHQYGLCLEPQFFPDSINCKNFITPILKKGKKYNSKIIFKLKNNF